MKKLLIVVCALSLTMGAFAAEQILNGNCESWTAGLPDNWTFVQIDGAGNPGNQGSFVITQNTTQQHGGASCIQMVNAASQWTYRYGLHTNSFQLAGWSPTKNFSGWLYGTGSAANTRFARGLFSGGIWSVQLTEQQALAALSTWTNITYGAWDMSTYPTRISVHVINAGTVLVDDVSVDGTVPVEVSAFTVD